MKISIKSMKTSYFENQQDLSSHIWRQDSQLLKTSELFDSPTTELKTSNFNEKKNNLNFRKFFLKKSQKTSYLENYKVLSSHSQLLTELHYRDRDFNFVKIFISKFSGNF